MAVDFAVLFQSLYPAGAGRQYVNPSTGNDSNAGSAGSPKRTIGAAKTTIGSGGGIIWCADGAYPPFTLSGSYGTNARLLVMAQNIEGPTIACGGQHGISITGQGIGVYGFQITGDGDTGSFVYQKCILINGNSRYVSVWKNAVSKGCETGIGVPSQGLVTDYLDICYNTVVECGRWFYYAGSGISLYECRELDNNAGVHYNIIGNVCYHNYNNTNTANTDGNGIIIDDFSNTQYDAHVNSTLVLVAMNLCVDNGGRGTHSPWTPTVHNYFNTTASNMWNIGTHSRTGENSVAGSGSIGRYNVIYPKPASLADGASWSSYFRNTYGGSIDTNVVLAGAGYHGNGTNRSRTAEGLNYFKNNAPTVAPRTSALADQWRPDGGSGAVETVVLSQPEYDELVNWPDMFGEYRPARTSGWALGFAESAVILTGTNATVPAVSVRAAASVPSPSITAGSTINATVPAASIRAVAAASAPTITCSATVTVAATGAVAGIGVGVYGQLVVVNATVVASPIAGNTGMDAPKLGAFRPPRARYLRFLGKTRQRPTG